MKTKKKGRPFSRMVMPQKLTTPQSVQVAGRDVHELAANLELAWKAAYEAAVRKDERERLYRQIVEQKETP